MAANHPRALKLSSRPPKPQNPSSLKIESYYLYFNVYLLEESRAHKTALHRHNLRWRCCFTDILCPTELPRGERSKNQHSAAVLANLHHALQHDFRLGNLAGIFNRTQPQFDLDHPSGAAEHLFVQS